MTIALTVLGAGGKMGQKVWQLARQDPHFKIVALYSRKKLKLDDENIIAFNDPHTALAFCDVAIDFTSSETTEQHLEAAISAKKALVIGTTGLSQETEEAIKNAARAIPILYSPNFSLGMALCLETAARLGKVLFNRSAIDIHEVHHIRKKDRPSGTALELAKAIGRGKIILENSRAEPRNNEEIVIHSMRSGETIGEHALIFECGHETIEIKHTAHSRDAFAHGALLAAKFLANQPPGFYTLKNVFNNSYTDNSIQFQLDPQST